MYSYRRVETFCNCNIFWKNDVQLQRPVAVRSVPCCSDAILAVCGDPKSSKECSVIFFLYFVSPSVVVSNNYTSTTPLYFINHEIATDGVIYSWGVLFFVLFFFLYIGNVSVICIPVATSSGELISLTWKS